MGAHFEAIDEGVLLVPLDPRYTQVGLNLVSVQVCDCLGPMKHVGLIPTEETVLASIGI